MPSVKQFIPLNVAVLTVSDTRDEETDTSGRYLVDAVKEAGHHVIENASVWMISTNLEVL